MDGNVPHIRGNMAFKNTLNLTTLGILYFLLALIFSACMNGIFCQPSYFKRIFINQAEIQWFDIALIDQQSSDFVVVKRPDESSDTICKASNIADVVLIGFDTIKVTFKSAPQNFG